MFALGSVTSLLNQALYFLFGQITDSGIFMTVNVVYDIFFVIAKIDIFGGTTIGQNIYDNLSSRIYMMISLAMVFIFAYNLLLYIMKPEGTYVSDKLKPGTLMKRITFSMVLIILTPLIFKYMSIFQNHVISSDTIPAIVLGEKAGSGKAMTQGKKLALISYMTFVHPKGTTYANYVKNPEANNCWDYFYLIDSEFVLNMNATQKTWAIGLQAICQSPQPLQTLTLITNNLMPDMEYLFLLSTIGGTIMVVFGVAYIYSVAGRVFKLFVLQIFAPIPILMRIFNKEKNFDPWLKEITSTYVDLFARIAVISFVLYFCSLLPTIFDSIEAGVFYSLMF